MTTIRPSALDSRYLTTQSLREPGAASRIRRTVQTNHADTVRAASAQTQRISGARRTPSAALLQRLQGLGVSIQQRIAQGNAQASPDAKATRPPAVSEKPPLPATVQAAAAQASEETLPTLETLRANFGRQNGATVSDGDLNGDGAVTLADLALYQQREVERTDAAQDAEPTLETIRQNFGRENATRADGDLNGDGRVDLGDFAMASQSIDATG